MTGKRHTHNKKQLQVLKNIATITNMQSHCVSHHKLFLPHNFNRVLMCSMEQGAIDSLHRPFYSRRSINSADKQKRFVCFYRNCFGSPIYVTCSQTNTIRLLWPYRRNIPINVKQAIVLAIYKFRSTFFLFTQSSATVINN